jgi:hypothetical protein
VGVQGNRMKKILRKILCWTLGIVFGLPITLYLILLAINWRDQPPSPLVQQLTAQVHAESNVASVDNGYVDLMGFDVEPGEDVRAMGLKRIAWMETRMKVGFEKAGSDPLADPYIFVEKRDSRIKVLSDTCSKTSGNWYVDPQCMTAIEDTAAIEQWLKSESWLLDRYLAMTKRSKWNEHYMFDAESPWPRYTTELEAQKLLLVKVALLARAGDMGGARNLLASDAQHWRRVQAASKTLISKMIATAALKRHFGVANIALRRASVPIQQQAIPSEWRVPISDDERSMRPVMIGEWVLSSSLTRELAVSPLPPAYSGTWVDGDSFLSTISWYLAKPLLQSQFSSNKTAENYVRVARVFDSPYSQLIQLLSAPKDEDFSLEPKLFFPRSFYNLTGEVLGVSANNESTFSSYVRRVADIEGVRRATLAAFDLRAASVTANNVAEALKKSEYRNPYNNQPFEWDAESKAIVFNGLEAGERGVHRIYY